VLRVGAPVLYIGPAESHVGDIFEAIHSGQMRSVRHGDVDGVVSHITSVAARAHQPNPREIAFATRFSHQMLVQQFLRRVDEIFRLHDRVTDGKNFS